MATNSDLLESVKVDQKEKKRGFMENGGFLPDEPFRKCLKCSHIYVDKLPENRMIVQRNNNKKKRNAEQKRHWKDFSNGLRADPPKKNGRSILNSPPVDEKYEKLLLQCHCIQMRRVRPKSNVQSTCPVNCKDTAGSLYFPGSCPICTCSCNYIFEKSRWADIRDTVLVETQQQQLVDLSREGK